MTGEPLEPEAATRNAERPKGEKRKLASRLPGNSYGRFARCADGKGPREWYLASRLSYLVHPFSENDEFFGRMCQVASTAGRIIHLIQWQHPKNGTAGEFSAVPGHLVALLITKHGQRAQEHRRGIIISHRPELFSMWNAGHPKQNAATLADIGAGIDLPRLAIPVFNQCPE